MSELLAPVGNKEAFYAAIANGCDAVYLGLNKHNARAYANNFSLENLKEYVDYAHVRNVRVFVTLNTIVYDNELDEIYSMIDELAELNVDAIIVQDLAVLNYAVNNYKSLEVHASTQMGIDDVWGAKTLMNLGVKRVVLARETPVNTIKEIKNKTNIEVEAFIHGALCVSYSGNCFMSGALGERSGNRGRCAGCCRKQYSLIDLDSKEVIKTGYLLSMKDLNLSSHIKDMKFIDSFKIEGRMKEESYVAAVTNIYRHLLDNEQVDKNDLNKVFNRTYTKGFINSEDSKDITNIDRPNNFGYLVGKISKVNNNKIWLKLFKEVNHNDLLRVENEDANEDAYILLTKMFDANFNVVQTADKTAILYTDKKVKVGANVYKVKDAKFLEQVNVGDKNKEYKKNKINVTFTANVGETALLKISYGKHVVFQKSEFIVSEALNKPTDINDVSKQLNKLNDTPFEINELIANIGENCFIPLAVINVLRRKAIEKLINSITHSKVVRNKNKTEIIPQKHEEQIPIITIEVSNQTQYDFVKSLGYQHIYFKNKINRNNATYVDGHDEVLIGGLSGISYYKDKNVKLVGDISLNTNNHVSLALLSSLGLERITLSTEMNENQINNLIINYKNTYNTHPNIEYVIYGRMKLMHSKYCPLRRLGMCGKCKQNNYALKDNYESFPLSFNEDCTVNLMNSKILNLIDEIPNLKGINYFRLSFTDESIEEIDKILEITTMKIAGEDAPKFFDGRKHTRGNFKKELL